MALLRMSARTLFEKSDSGGLAAELAQRHRSAFRDSPGPGERRSWANSLPALGSVLRDAELDDVEVLIEQKLPLTSLRADAILAGSHPATGRPSYVVVELKQWSAARLVPGADDLCQIPGGGNRARLHPVAQVRRYCDYLRDFTSVLSDEHDVVTGIAYLHNAAEHDIHELFCMAEPRAQLFTETNRGALIRHLQTRLAPQSGSLEADDLLNSPIAPGRQLMRLAADEIIEGDNFRLMDEQQIAASLVKRAVDRSRRSDQKEVIVISGGPGSGKSLIALHLMGHLGRSGRSAVHATGSKSFTTTLQHVGREGDKRLPGLFRYFNQFEQAERNGLDALICDEAHRMRVRSSGSSTSAWDVNNRRQVEELIDAARVPVFLLDEHQVVRPGEMGSVREIKQAAQARGCLVRHVDLNEQFRNGGSRVYEHWVLRLLGLDEGCGGPVPWQPDGDFELLVADSPLQMERYLRAQHKAGYTARMTAGFCWPWSAPRNDGSLVEDISIGDWRKPWNAKEEAPGAPISSLWATEQGGFGQVGCIYTAQGFEYPYNGVIFGPDLVWRNDRWRPDKSASRDGRLARTTLGEFSRLVRNTYKVLLTRGLAGTVVCSTDPETQAMLRSLIPHNI